MSPKVLINKTNLIDTENKINEILPKIRKVRIYDTLFFVTQFFFLGFIVALGVLTYLKMNQFNDVIDKMDVTCPYITCPDNSGSGSATLGSNNNYQAVVAEDPNSPEVKPLPTGIDKIDNS